jgi:hypothetical protein
MKIIKKNIYEFVLAYKTRNLTHEKLNFNKLNIK